MGLTGIHWAIIKCAVVCFAVILAVIILRVYHSPLGPSISRWYYRAYVDDAILTSLHPANLSSTTSSSSIRYQLSLNINFKTVSYGAAGYRDCFCHSLGQGHHARCPPRLEPGSGQGFHGGNGGLFSFIHFFSIHLRVCRLIFHNESIIHSTPPLFTIKISF